jgi:hypothetical protein
MWEGHTISLLYIPCRASSCSVYIISHPRLQPGLPVEDVRPTFSVSQIPALDLQTCPGSCSGVDRGHPRELLLKHPFSRSAPQVTEYAFSARRLLSGSAVAVRSSSPGGRPPLCGVAVIFEAAEQKEKRIKAIHTQTKTTKEKLEKEKAEHVVDMNKAKTKVSEFVLRN